MAEAFAATGFALPTREIARRLGVTQALLYRCFPSKEALAEAVLERHRRQRAWPDPAILTGGKGDLAARLTAFYRDYLGAITPLGLRLLLRANLNGLLAELRRLHGAAAAPGLTVPQLRPGIGWRRGVGLRRSGDRPGRPSCHHDRSPPPVTRAVFTIW